MSQDLSFITRFKTLLRAYRAQKDGTASIEFVLIAPVMIFLYIGLYELSIAYSVNGSVNRSSEIAASFPTFEADLDENIMANVMTAATAVLDYTSFDPNNLAIDIYSIEQVTADTTSRRLVGKASYAGSQAGGLLNDLSASDFTNILSSISAGNGFIVAQVAYLYEPAITNEFVQAVTLTDRKILNPRENQGLALNLTTVAGQERANLNCSLDSSSMTFTCSFANSFPEDQGQTT